jgi:hypothetical protein
MKPDMTNRPNFWTTVRLLLNATRKRSMGRRRRQQELLNNRSGKSGGTNWGAVGFAFSLGFMVLLNGGAAWVVGTAVESGQRIEVERTGKIVVTPRFMEPGDNFPLNIDYSNEARRISERYGGNKADIEQKLRNSVRQHGVDQLIPDDEAAPGLEALGKSGPLPAMLGSLVLFWWALMLVFQGEGLELDLQRRRNPMWEWLLSHPIPPGALFLAEMLSPIAANPIYWGAPLFAGVLFGQIYGFQLGLLATVLLGIPMSIAAACLGKALEIGAVLRVAPRTRGALVGIMSWLGYASMMGFIVSVFILPKIVTALQKPLFLLAKLPWPWLKLTVGLQSDGTFSFASGALFCLAAAGLTLAGSVWFSVWATNQGLSGNFAAERTRPSAPAAAAARFGRDPLYRKEFLWFMRDRSAIVQTILIPITVAGLQAFNMRGILTYANGAWNYLCGIAIVFGTYFLWILGPKSLQSEGTALWIAMTWPRGLESLLKAKAWLWSILSSGIVALVLCYAAFVFPGSIGKIVLVGIGWFLFSRSMAEKAVTLVTVTPESGEPQKVSRGRRWGAQLGMLTFAIGVVTEQWPLAVTGIVYSYLTAAAMWENFRAHLPYLYDPWSETIPPPPTLMHAMISISILVEVGAVVTGTLSGLIHLVTGSGNIAVAQAFSYAICSVGVFFGVSNFLENRGVYPREVWNWTNKPAVVPPPPPPLPLNVQRRGGIYFSDDPVPVIEDVPLEPFWSAFGLNHRAFFPALAVGAAGGVLLGLCGRGYLAILAHLPFTAERIRQSQQLMTTVPFLHISYAVMAILFAPFAEEYLFRGILYRALDREWGGWQAVLGSAAFFAIYHPPLSWLPVALVGAANCLLFKRTRSLFPCILLHMAYNAVVLL